MPIEAWMTRVLRVDDGIFSILEYGDGSRLMTVERPWLGNRPFVSCVPCGEYDLVPHSSDDFGETWALVGDTVAHYREPSKPRWTCILHVANWARQVKGCVGPGLSFMPESARVVESLPAMTKLRKDWALDEVHKLTIRSALTGLGG